MPTSHAISVLRRVLPGLALFAAVGVVYTPPVAARTPTAGAGTGGTTAVAQVAPDSVGPAGPAAAAEPGSELRVWLVTAGPGDAVWERYGHNAIRVLDTRTGRDVSYNWGIFDFQQVDFIPRFLQGRMLYMMAPFSTPAMIDAYARANREVVLQELSLTPAEKLELRNLAEINALPENRDYLYQYFLDNCSTRVRDLLDLVLDGRLRAHFADQPTQTSYRFHTRRLNQVDPFIYTGLDLLMGTPTDKPLSVWEEMFLPLTLRDEIRNVEVAREDGTTTPLVMDERIAAPSARPAEPDAPPGWLPFYAILGALLGALLAALGSTAARTSAALRRTILTAGVLWTLLGGIAGTILVLLLFTDHTFAYWNENLFLVHPLLLALAFTLPMAGRSEPWRRRARAVATVVLVVAVLGLLGQMVPISRQQNAMFLALFLPTHAGLWWGLRGHPTVGKSPTGKRGIRSLRPGSGRA